MNDMSDVGSITACGRRSKPTLPPEFFESWFSKTQKMQQLNAQVLFQHIDSVMTVKVNEFLDEYTYSSYGGKNSILIESWCEDTAGLEHYLRTRYGAEAATKYREFENRTLKELLA